MHRLLDFILWAPLLGMLTILLLPSAKKQLIRWTSLLFTAITFILTIMLYMKFDNTLTGMQNAFNVKGSMD